VHQQRPASALNDAKKAAGDRAAGPRLRIIGSGQLRRLLSSSVSSASRRNCRLAVDLLTTNETYFFPRAEAFRLPARAALPQPAGPPVALLERGQLQRRGGLHLAMLLADVLGEAPVGGVGTDISRSGWRRRSAALPMERPNEIPLPLLKKYCLKGTAYQGCCAS
jgi:chemotaxis protein methyltransferase CheR